MGATLLARFVNENLFNRKYTSLNKSISLFAWRNSTEKESVDFVREDNYQSDPRLKT